MSTQIRELGHKLLIGSGVFFWGWHSGFLQVFVRVTCRRSLDWTSEGSYILLLLPWSGPSHAEEIVRNNMYAALRIIEKTAYTKPFSRFPIGMSFIIISFKR